MSNFKNEIKDNFTVVRNDIIQNTGLTAIARFVYVYMSSKPHDWVFYQSPLAKELGFSVETLRKYIKELKLNGVLTSEQTYNSDGTFGACSFTLNAGIKVPYVEKPDTVKTRHGKNPTRIKTDTVNLGTTKERLKQKKDNNKRKTDISQSQAIDAPPPKKRNVVDWDWTDRIVERFGVTEKLAKDFIDIRKKGKWQISDRTFNNFCDEVKKVNEAGFFLAEKDAFAWWVKKEWRGFESDWYLKGKTGQAKTGYKTKETIEECMARLSKSESARAELDITPSKNGLCLPFFDDLEDSDPFACQQQNNP